MSFVAEVWFGECKVADADAGVQYATFAFVGVIEVDLVAVNQDSPRLGIGA